MELMWYVKHSVKCDERCRIKRGNVINSAIGSFQMNPIVLKGINVRPWEKSSLLLRASNVWYLYFTSSLSPPQFAFITPALAPWIVHGNGSKWTFARYSNGLKPELWMHKWRLMGGCRASKENSFSLVILRSVRLSTIFWPRRRFYK
jgi:hypothetical protein